MYLPYVTTTLVLVVSGGGHVNRFSEEAFYLLVWRAILVALIAVVLMVTRSFELAAAFLIGANVALLFLVGLIAWKSHLDEQQIVRTEAWRALAPEERPAGEAGRRWALNSLRLAVCQGVFRRGDRPGWDRACDVG
jgi:hypothetical protein